MLKKKAAGSMNCSQSRGILRGRGLRGFVLCFLLLMCFSATAMSAEIPVDLGSAGDFAVLAYSTVTNVPGVGTVVTGDIGVSPGSAVVGFGPGVIIGDIEAGTVVAQTAQSNLTTAYNDAAGRVTAPTGVAGNLGGMTLYPGLYKSTSSLEISSGDLTLDARGDPNAVFIFQMASTLTVTNGRQVILSGSANAYNIFWQVGSSATFGTTSVFKGTILAQVAITFNSGATLEGRALARTAAVTLDNNIITLPLAPPAPTPTPDVPTPTPDVPTPTPDVPTPTQDVLTPTPDVPTPTPDVPTPTPDVPTPTPDVPTPTPDVPTPTPDAPTPTPDVSTPTPEAPTMTLVPSTPTPTQTAEPPTPTSAPILPTETNTPTVTPAPTATPTPLTPITGELAVNLGSAGDFAVLAGSTITNVASDGTTITGDIGVSPGTEVVGFPPGIVNGTIHAGDDAAAQAQADLTVTYNELAGRSTMPFAESGNLGGKTLFPGLINSTSSLEISSGDLTLDALGDPGAIFIFQIATTLTVSNGRMVILSGGAKASNIFWQVGTSATFGTASVFKGSILAHQSITFNTGATLDGRALAINGAVTMESNTIVAYSSDTIPTPTLTNTPVPPTPTATSTPVPVLPTPTRTQASPPVKPLSVLAAQINQSLIKVSWPSDENEVHMLHTYRDKVYIPKFSGNIAQPNQNILLNLTEQDAGLYTFFLRGLNSAGDVSAWTVSNSITVTAPVNPESIGIYDNSSFLTDLSGGIDYDASNTRMLILGWQVDPPESSDNTIDYHIYKIDAFAPSGLGQYIGRTGSGGSANTFDWKNAPYGTHQFGIFALRSGKFPLGPFLSGSVTLAPAVTVTDDADSLIDLSNGEDKDPVNARELVLRWNFDTSDIPDANNVKDVHVYVKANDGQYVYLGRTGNALDTMFVWKQTTLALTAPDFRSGPQYGNSYQFMVYQLKTVTETGDRAHYGPFHNSGPVSYSQQ